MGWLAKDTETTGWSSFRVQLAVHLALAVSFAAFTTWLLVLRVWPAAAIWAVPTLGLLTRVVVLIRLRRMVAEAAGPANVDDIDQRLDALGYLRVGWLDAITARPATPDEAAVLRLEAGQPVVDHTRVQYSMRIGDEVRPVSYIRTVFIGDRHRVVYHYKQPDVPTVDKPIASAGTT